MEHKSIGEFLVLLVNAVNQYFPGDSIVLREDVYYEASARDGDTIHFERGSAAEICIQTTKFARLAVEALDKFEDDFWLGQPDDIQNNIIVTIEYV